MERANRVPLTDVPGFSNGMHLDLGDYQCSDIRLISGAGASGLVYHAVSSNYYGTPGAAVAKLIVKECYPHRLARHLVRQGVTLSLLDTAPQSAQKEYDAYVQSYREAFAKQTHLYQGQAREYVSVPSRAREANGTIYIVTDVSNGATLAQQAPGMSVKGLMDALGMTCSALDALHAEGYAYLDLKPENILIVPGADKATCTAVRLFDFDACQLIGQQCEGGLVMGTRGWSSYEQMHESGDYCADARSDVYSIGALLFWMLVGRAPTYAEVIHADGVWRLRPSNLADNREAFCSSEALALTERILSRTLVAEPDRRYANVAELSADLAELTGFVVPASQAAREAVALLRSGVGEDIYSAARGQQDARLERQATLRKRVAIGIAAGAIVLGLVAGAFALHPWTGTAGNSAVGAGSSVGGGILAGSTTADDDLAGDSSAGAEDMTGAEGAAGAGAAEAPGASSANAAASGLSEASIVGRWDATSYVADAANFEDSDIVFFAEGDRSIDFAADGTGTWLIDGTTYGCDWVLSRSQTFDDGTFSLVFTVSVGDAVYDFNIWEYEKGLAGSLCPRGENSSTIYCKDCDWTGSGLEADKG